MGPEMEEANVGSEWRGGSGSEPMALNEDKHLQHVLPKEQT